MDIISITSGSDATLQFLFQDEAEAAIPITSPVVVEASGDLNGKCTTTLVDGPNGLASITIEGTSMVTVGKYYLRLQVELSDGTSLASERVEVHVR
jgi:hypothetical protein